MKDIHVVLLQREKWWVAQCLQYDIGAQAHTVDDVLYELQRSLIGHMAIASAHGREPFVNLPPAPDYYWKKFQGRHIKISEPEDLPFRAPISTSIPRAEYRIAS